jgi:hypothetical protein
VFIATLRDSPVLLVIGLALAAALTAASFSGRRIPCALASFVTGFGPWGLAFILGAPFLVFAFLLVRAGRQVGDDRHRPGTRR